MNYYFLLKTGMGQNETNVPYRRLAGAVVSDLSLGRGGTRIVCFVAIAKATRGTLAAAGTQAVKAKDSSIRNGPVRRIRG